MRYKSVFSIKDTGGFEYGGFYGFRGEFEQNKETLQEQMRLEMEGRKQIIDTFGEDTKNGKNRK